MSDFLPHDILNEIWEEILKQHWSYLETEESIIKIEKRKKLEDCLKEYLCIVQHDRKFMLPETAKVLKKSIWDYAEFSAQKAITAFESISQYANNLFTKPWRNEFRILKMYSGFYQHEIKSNLLDAEILFEAMGYRRLSENTLILDGPICPDQVTNVSRDAMIAYVELQIIKQIYSGLHAIGLNCSWHDIFRYRETVAGDVSQAIKDLAYSIDEQHFRTRQKSLIGDNYGYIDTQPSSNYFENTRFCPAQCECNIYQHAPQVSKHRPISQPNRICYVPEHLKHSPRNATNLIYSNMAAYNAHCQHHQHQNHQLMSNGRGAVPISQMSHSRSLEHYSEPSNHHHNMFLQRHSFDQQPQGCTEHHQYHTTQQLQQQHYCAGKHPQQNIYESSYDCIDGNSLCGGSSTISYAAVAGNVGAGAGIVGINCNLNSSSTYSPPYNVSGNRVPLPLNISKQLSAYDNVKSSNFNGSQEHTYAHIVEPHMYSSVCKLPQNCVMPSNNVYGVQNPLLVKESLQKQRSCQSDQLINFEDSVIMPPIPTSMHQFDTINQYRKNCDTPNHIMDNHYKICNIMDKSFQPPATSTYQQHYVSGNSAHIDDSYVYAKPTPRENRKQNAVNLPKLYNTGERGETTDIIYESANDKFVNLAYQENERHHLRSPTQHSKNEDGVGSSEQWNYVFQNLEKNGYSKDLGERNDLLDFQSLNIINDTSPSHSTSAEERKYISESDKKCTRKQPVQQHQQLEPQPKSDTFDNAKYISKNNGIMEKSSTANNTQKQKIPKDNNIKKIKSALKQTNATSKPSTSTNPNHHLNKTLPKPNDSKTLPKTVNNNNNDDLRNPGNGATKKLSSSTANVSKKSVTSTNAPPAQTNASSAKEWSCKTCTFLNPETTRICKMCFKTKGFILDSTSTATGATTVAHNTPTCA